MSVPFRPDLLRRCVFLAGPTAVGKTDASLALADRLQAEIVSLDSMCVYRGMDVGTAKPSPQARAVVPHHLIDILEPSEEFTLAEYLTLAEQACRNIIARGATPLFVGGTGLYLRSVLRGVFAGPPADPVLREALAAEAAAHGPEALHARLARVDPVAAARLPPGDVRRVVRALEVYELTGRPLSDQQCERPLDTSRGPAVLWLSPPRPWLHERINRRVAQMVAEGLFDEARRLLDSPRPLSRTARQAIAYREAFEHVQGVRDEAETVSLIQARTRQFAKRQHTWFRNLPECRPVPVEGIESIGERTARIAVAIEAMHRAAVTLRDP